MANAKKGKIVGVKELEKEFGLSGRIIRRHLRKMAENTKPRGPEPYQWYSDDPNFKAIRSNLKAVVARQPKLQELQQ
jgi:DeoR/GlpR family transcriptional regulator of sugar metabolism